TAYPVSRGQNPGDYNYSVSRQGMLIYRSGGDAGGQQLQWFDRGGKEAGSVGTMARIQSFRLSPDGKRVVVSRQRGDPSRLDLWVTAENGPESKITFDESRSNDPVWSPDGKTVAFASNRKGQIPNLYLKTSNGLGQDELLFESKEPVFPTDWSSDSRFLVFR